MGVGAGVQGARPSSQMVLSLLSCVPGRGEASGWGWGALVRASGAGHGAGGHMGPAEQTWRGYGLRTAGPQPCSYLRSLGGGGGGLGNSPLQGAREERSDPRAAGRPGGSVLGPCLPSEETRPLERRKARAGTVTRGFSWRFPDSALVSCAASGPHAKFSPLSQQGSGLELRQALRPASRGTKAGENGSGDATVETPLLRPPGSGVREGAPSTPS